MLKATVYVMNRDSKILKDYSPRLIARRGFQDVCETEQEKKRRVSAYKMNM